MYYIISVIPISDIFMASKTWLKQEETLSFLSDITPDGYQVFHKPVITIEVEVWRSYYTIYDSNFLTQTIII